MGMDNRKDLFADGIIVPTFAEPAADPTIERISDLLTLDLSALVASHPPIRRTAEVTPLKATQKDASSFP